MCKQPDEGDADEGDEPDDGDVEPDEPGVAEGSKHASRGADGARGTDHGAARRTVSGMSAETTPTASPAPPAADSSYLRLMQRQTAAANIRGQAAGGPDGSAAGLRVVEPVERARPELTGRRVLPETVADTLRLDAQGRGSARRLLAELGWTPDTGLVASLDTDRSLLWLQATDVGDAHGTDGSSCDCGRCQQATAGPPELPGQPRPVTETATVTSKGELNLTRGLLAGIGSGLSQPVVAFAVPDLHAVALAAPASLLDRLLAEQADGEVDEADTNVTPLRPARQERG